MTNKMSSPVAIMVAIVLEAGMVRYSTTRWSLWWWFDDWRLVGISLAVAQIGGSARVGKQPKTWEKFLGKWESDRAKVDVLDIATWHNLVISLGPSGVNLGYIPYIWSKS